MNQGCRDRKIETDKRRKQTIKDKNKHYDDDNPPDDAAGDDQNQEGDEEENSGTTRRRSSKPTCSHYRQLSSWRTARMTQQRFVLNAPRVSCCSVGGERTSLGVHDIEDLVSFGKNPHRERNIALYREAGSGRPFGINLTDRPGGGCQVDSVKENGVAAIDGRLQKGDWVLAVNGRSTRQWSLEQVSGHIRSITQDTDPLVLDVQRETAHIVEEESDEGGASSKHAVCPYYLSRALLPHANLVFCPYNYVLDPVIRKTLGLDLKGSVVVLDEAHNVEDTLCESGSGEFGELDLCQLISVLTFYSNQKKGHETENRRGKYVMLGSREEREVSEVAHELLLFVEKLVTHMRLLRERFEKSPGLQKTKLEHAKFHLPDNHSVEVSYHGPTGHGFKGDAIGCAPMLNEMGITSETCVRLSDFANSMETHLSGGDSGDDEHAGDSVLNDLINIISRLELAAKNPEHFYMACVMKPNGNIDYATEMSDEDYDEMKTRQPWRKDPRPIPFVSPRTDKQPNVPLGVCNHKECQSKNQQGYFVRDTIRHGSFCNGERPRWGCHLVLRLLSPGLLMKEISEQCRSVILASGSLAPLPSLCAELNLFGPKECSSKQSLSHISLQHSQASPSLNIGKVSQSQIVSQQPKSSPSPTRVEKLSQPLSSFSPNVVNSGEVEKAPKEPHGRLQVAPKPLEANHVVNLQKQLYAVGIGHFSDGSPLTVNYSHYKEPAFFPRLGHAIATVIESIPQGGVLVFVPSYSFLNKCITCWNPRIGDIATNPHYCPQIWTRLLRSKGNVIVEPTGNQDKFEEAKEEYSNKIKKDGKCILLAVFRGKMSEGISFNDDNARCVICVGLPYPNSFDRNIKAKKAYNDEQRKIRKNNHLLPGTDWYSQQAYRAVAQALGRCIRHGADYGAIVLMDSRHCDDGSPNDGICRAHKNLPKWMRHHIRTLSMRPTGGVGDNPVLGGFEGLRRELGSFFQRAPLHSREVLDKWKSELQKAQDRSREFQGHTFDRETGKWTSHSEKSVEKSKVKGEA